MVPQETTATEERKPAIAERARLYRAMLRIRRTEERLLELFDQGRLVGTTHTSIGQEPIAVAVMEALDPERDVVFSTHRGHGHYLAYGGPLDGLLAEIMGRSTGVCGGVGGSQHLHFRNFSTSGVQGAIVPWAVGAALAERRTGSGAISVVFLGDGTLGQGVVYESLNIASLWAAPTLFVLEDNGYAQTTPRRLGVAGEMAARAAAFGIDTADVGGGDVEELLAVFRGRVDRVRNEQRPFFQVVRTYRLAAHSKGDDDRDPEEIAVHWSADPLLLTEGRLGREVTDEAEEAVRVELDAAVAAAEAAPWPTRDTPSAREPGSAPGVAARRKEPGTVVESLNASLHRLMEGDDRVLLLGEDVLDPYGGAFKVTRGLSERFPDRVRTTPISEAGIVGVANGMALRGLRPIVEIMFGDFITLAADQIINHASKFAGMYDGAAACPVTVRTPMGGRRGYGPTHSQSLERLFMGVTGLDVVAPSPLHAAGELLERVVADSDGPTLFVENKLMYGRRLVVPDEHGFAGPFQIRSSSERFPTVRVSLDEFRTPDVVLLTYGGSAELCLEAAERLLLEDEIACEVVVPSLLSPLAASSLLEPTAACGRVVIVEEGVASFGWGAEVAAALVEASPQPLRLARLGASDSVIPSSRPLEDAVLPQVDDIVSAVRELT